VKYRGTDELYDCRAVSARLDAVTIDAYGTLVELVDPLQPLQDALRRHGVERDLADVAKGFQAEVDYYVERSHEGRDEATLALLRQDCARIFLHGVGAEIPAAEFVHDFIGSLRFAPVEGAPAACRVLAARGLRLAVVSNWDVGLHDHIAALGLNGLFGAVVTSAEAGAPKPDPAVFHLALERLGVSPGRAAHVGDSEADEEGARAAGIRFVPAPLVDAARSLA
jgi:putative hydrolase of the HAD superfamily